MKTKQILADSIAKLNAISEKIELVRDCERCGGTGKREHWDKTRTDKVPCNNCGQQGCFYRPMLGDLLKMVVSIQNDKLRLRSASPKRGNHTACRAAYVWRIARFNGGEDVTMPMMAPMMLGDDPYKEYLEALADFAAKACCGTNMAGALRWAPLLGSASFADVEKYMANNPQPASALPCGPVVMD
jgi:hypothetical protein